MKKLFLTGLASILPIILTLWIVKWILNLLTVPFFGLMPPMNSYLALFISQIIIITIIFSFIILIGFLGQLFLISAVLKLFDRLMLKIPFANKIYKSVQDIVHIIFAQEKPAFTKTVIVPYPHPHSKAIGFIANENLTGSLVQEFSSVYVVGAPNPMMGFVLLLPKNKITSTSTSVKEAAQFTISCGILTFQNNNHYTQINSKIGF